MAQEVKVTSKEFSELKNPYTGLTMDVRMVVTGKGEPLFHAGPNEYTTQTVMSDKDEAHRQWSRVNGVQGMRNGPVRCAYTGDFLSPDPSDGGFAYEGGFDPKLLYTREEFLYRASMRNGVSKYGKPTGEVQRVEKVTRVEITAKRKSAERGVRLTDEAVDRAAASMQLHKDEFAQRASVSMSVPSARKGKSK